jgi:hypothetical protein
MEVRMRARRTGRDRNGRRGRRSSRGIDPSMDDTSSPRFEFSFSFRFVIGSGRKKKGLDHEARMRVSASPGGDPTRRPTRSQSDQLPVLADVENSISNEAAMQGADAGGPRRPPDPLSIGWWWRLLIRVLIIAIIATSLLAIGQTALGALAAAGAAPIIGQIALAWHIVVAIYEAHQLSHEGATVFASVIATIAALIELLRDRT